jgi:hypothetical protein
VCYPLPAVLARCTYTALTDDPLQAVAIALGTTADAIMAVNPRKIYQRGVELALPEGASCPFLTGMYRWQSVACMHDRVSIHEVAKLGNIAN